MKGKTPWLIAAGAVVLVLIIAAAFALLNPTHPAKRPAAAVGPQPPSPSAPAAPPAPPVPFAYSSKANGVDLSLKLPQALADAPELHARLYNSGMTELHTFAKQSAGQKNDIGVPYEHDLVWTVAAQTDKLTSLESDTYEFSGGAHGNTALQSLLWDRSLKAQIKPMALFKSGADHARLDGLLCRAIMTAKKAREQDGFNASDSMWPCPKWAQSVFVLAPSDQAGKAGGVTFLFSPYAIGPYSDGVYEITIPQQAFHNALAPAYADEFAGKPPKVGDTTPTQ
ncbi:MAG TPA: DUF4163 domain-containing protein [Caulobacteraceae bacterium]|jgi:hypothetical protein|nr:DUF4163 domain-containing protein [Caulobacteraceae bacterium]